MWLRVEVLSLKNKIRSYKVFKARKWQYQIWGLTDSILHCKAETGLPGEGLLQRSKTRDRKRFGSRHSNLETRLQWQWWDGELGWLRSYLAPQEPLEKERRMSGGQSQMVLYLHFYHRSRWQLIASQKESTKKPEKEWPERFPAGTMSHWT